MKYTPTHNLPYPDGSDSVAPQSRDFQDLAVATAAALTDLLGQTMQTGILGAGPDLNGLTTPGVYGAYGSPTNRPSDAAASGTVVNLPANGAAVSQEWIDFGDSGARWKRYSGSSGWSAWTRTDGSDAVRDAGFIGISGDLDTATTAGVYGYWSTSTNAPGDLSGVVWVAPVNTPTNVVQLAIEYGTAPGIYTRFQGSGGWSAWTRTDAGGLPSDGGSDTSPTALKTAAVALSASTSAVTEAVAAGSIRFPFKVAAPLTRWRLHIRNFNDRMGTAYNAGASFTGLWVGQHAGLGAFTSAPTQIAGPFTLPADGSEVVTSWSNVPLGDGVERLLSLGWTGATGPNTQSPAGAYRSTSSATGGATSGAGYSKSAYAPFSWWVEVETLATTPIVAMWGDSITAGTGNDLILHDSPLSQYARTIGAIPVHYAYPGTGMVAWPNANTHQWARWANLSKVDAVIHFMGQNDLNGAGTLAAMQDRFNDTINLLREHVSPNIYLATLTPHSGKTEAINTVRKSYNTWLKTLPGGARDVFDFSAAVQNATNDAILPAYTSDSLHLTTLGSTQVANAITRPVTSPAVDATAALDAYLGTIN